MKETVIWLKCDSGYLLIVNDVVRTVPRISESADAKDAPVG